MAYSYYIYSGTGSQTQFSVAFDYIRREHVAVTVNNVAATFTWVNSSTIQMDTAPANGTSVRVYRVTPLSAPLVDFTDGATLVAADLDTNAKQSIYTQQELDDRVAENQANAVPDGDKGDITTSATGTVWTIDAGVITETKLATGAVTSAKIADNTIVDADINTSAAVAATKLAFAPAGNVSATTVQTAIQQLDTLKGRPTNFYTPVAASAYGNLISFTSIPTFATQITVNFVGLATNGSSNIYIRLGTAADNILNSGYTGNSFMYVTGTTYAGLFDSTGFLLYRDSRLNAITGTINITLQGLSGSNYTWIASGNFCFTSGVVGTGSTVSSKIVTSSVDRVHIASSGGDLFNAGSVNVSYTD
jgi:hypothetical protein